MEQKKKTLRLGGVLMALFIVCGCLLMYKGNDAVVQATKRKEGILTAEQVRVAFDSVGARLKREAVQEGDYVKKGDVLMELDSTDIDLSIERTRAQIAQLEAQIRSMEGSIALGFSRAATDEQQSFRQIDQQRAAIRSARSTYENAARDYERKEALFADGAIAAAVRDDAATALSVAAENVRAQEEVLERLLAGAVDTGSTESLSLPTIENARMEAANRGNDAAALAAQKAQLEVSLKELLVKKERLTLRAPEDGKILQVIAKAGEMINPGTPVVLLESKRCYYDIYVSEEQAVHLSEGERLAGESVAGAKRVEGTIRWIAQAPGFADLKQTREKGQTDLSAFQVRIYTDEGQGVLPGMTIEVKDDAFPEG